VFEPGCFVGDLLVVEDEAGCVVGLVRSGFVENWKWMDGLLFQTLWEKHAARPLEGIS
jgi:hypothetical protein